MKNVILSVATILFLITLSNAGMPIGATWSGSTLYGDSGLWGCQCPPVDFISCSCYNASGQYLVPGIYPADLVYSPGSKYPIFRCGINGGYHCKITQ